MFFNMWVTLIVVAIGFFYWKLKQKFNHWKKKGVFYHPPDFIFGNIRERIFMKISFHEFQKNLYFSMKGHQLAGLYEGSSPNLMILDPELIKCVLIRDFDHFTDRSRVLFKPSAYFDKMLIVLNSSEWKNVRTSITPTFSTGKIKGMLDLVLTCGEQLTQYLNNILKESGATITVPVDAKDLVSKFTLDVIASCAFGVQCDSLKTPNAKFALEISKFNDVPVWQRMIIFAVLICQIPPFITRLLPISFMNPKTINFLAQVVKETTSIRREKNVRRNDFLQLLMDAEIADQDTPLSEDVLIAQSVLFFIAGYETSSTLLATACYELAKNKDIQDTLRKEINKELVKHSGLITYESVSNMSYLDMVLAETLRMYPPVARLDRICTEECSIGGVEIKAGDRINIPVIGLHYDPDYWPQPEKFDPLRFSQNEKSSRSPYVYLPFGAGPRNCIGLRFAQMTTKVCMIYILKQFTVNVCDETEIPFKYNKRSMLLKAENGIKLQFAKIS